MGQDPNISVLLVVHYRTFIIAMWMAYATVAAYVISLIQPALIHPAIVILVGVFASIFAALVTQQNRCIPRLKLLLTVGSGLLMLVITLVGFYWLGRYYEAATLGGWLLTYFIFLQLFAGLVKERSKKRP